MIETREDEVVLIRAEDNNSLERKLRLLYQDNHNKIALVELTPFSVIRYALYIIALNSGWPFAKPASLYAESNRALAFMYGASAVISLGSIATWALIDYFEYIGLIRHNTGTNKVSEIIIAVTAGTLGSGSALPGLIISYRYNHNIPILGLSFYLDATTNTCSLNRVFRETVIDLRYLRQPKLKQMRDVILERLMFGTSYAITHGTVTNIDTFEVATLTDDNFINILRSTTKAANNIVTTRQLHPYVYRHGRKTFILAVMIVLPLSWEITTSYVVYNQLRDEQKFPKAPSGAITLVTTVPTYFLESIFAMLVANKIYSIIADLFFDIFTSSAVIKNYPIIAFPIMLVGLFLVSFGFSAKAKIVDDTFDDSILKMILMLVTIVGAIAYKSIAILCNLDNTIRNIAISKSSNNKAFIFERALEQIRTVLENSRPADVTSFLERLDIAAIAHEVPEDIALQSAFNEWQREKLALQSTNQRRSCVPAISFHCCDKSTNDNNQENIRLAEEPNNTPQP